MFENRKKKKTREIPRHTPPNLATVGAFSANHNWAGTEARRARRAPESACRERVWPRKQLARAPAFALAIVDFLCGEMVFRHGIHLQNAAE